jgi:hypothetical protein
VEFAKARNAFRKTLSESRRAWYQETLSQREETARERERLQERAKRRQVDIKKLDSDRQKDRDVKLMEIEQHNKSKKAMKALRRAENVQREFDRQAILGSLQEGRYKALLEHSKHWIGSEEELDAEIDRAIDNAESMFVSHKVVGHRQQ